MFLNDLLLREKIDPQHVLVLRHRPDAPALNKVLPWLAVEKPDVFNAYQQTQGERAERAMQSLVGKGYVASFIGIQPGRAVYVGLYSILGSRPLSRERFWKVPAYRELKGFGMRGFAEEIDRNSVLWFDLELNQFYSDWKGKMVVSWPPPERSWWRRAHRNEIPIIAIAEESLLEAGMPSWERIAISWDELQVLPSSWKTALSHWRGIYFIFDYSDGKGYVGSAYGSNNLLGRWQNYANRGHGGNRLLIQRDPKNFSFTILQRVSPDMDAQEVIIVENSWKERLHTRSPFGLNEN
jgi:hypothetical protein